MVETILRKTRDYAVEIYDTTSINLSKAYDYMGRQYNYFYDHYVYPPQPPGSEEE